MHNSSTANDLKLSAQWFVDVHMFTLTILNFNNLPMTILNSFTSVRPRYKLHAFQTTQFEEEVETEFFRSFSLFYMMEVSQILASSFDPILFDKCS